MTTYNNTVVAKAPYVYLTVDETGTTTTNLGSLGGSYTYGANITKGQTGAGTTGGFSIKVPNQTTGGAITTATTTLPANFTVEAWYRNDTGFGGSTTQRLWSHGTFEMTIQKTTGYFRVSDGTLNDGFTDTSIVNGSWHHLVVTKSGGTYTFYKDGVNIGTKSGSSASRASASLVFGGSTSTTSHASWLDEGAVYPTTLSDAQVLDNYNTGNVSAINISVAAPATTTDLTAQSAVIGVSRTIAVTPATSILTSVPATNLQTSSTAVVSTSALTTPAPVVTAVDNSVVTLNPTADWRTGITSGGTTQLLNSDNSIFKFNPVVPNGWVIQSAILRLYNQSGSGTMNWQTRKVTTSWTESDTSSPGVSATPIDSGTKTISGSTYHEFDVTNTIKSGDIDTLGFSLYWASGVINSYGWSSREATNKPQLVVTIAQAPQTDVNAVVPPVTSDLAPQSATVNVIRNIVQTVTPAITELIAMAPVADVTFNPDYTVQAEVVESALLARDANVVGGSDIKVTVPYADMGELIATDVEFNNRTDVTVRVNPAVSDLRSVGIYKRELDRYLNFVPSTIDVDDIWYQMEETSGTVANDAAEDPSYTGQDGIYVGSPEFGVDGPYLRKAVRFDGTDYLKIGSTISALDYTIEFSIRTTQQNGTLFTSDGGDSNVTLVGGQMYMGQMNAVVPPNRVRKNIADGEWHHVVISRPYFGMGTTFQRPFFVMIDGVVEFRRNDATYGVPGTPETAFARYNRNKPAAASDFLAGEMRDLIVRKDYAVSIDTANNLYYEWSDAVVVEAVSVTSALTTPAPKVKGNVKKMLAIYGLPYTLDSRGQGILADRSIFAGFTVQSKPFYLGEYLVYPISITGLENSAEGIQNREYIDVFQGRYVDDKTGEMRFIDLDKDLNVDVTEFDAITVVNYPAISPSDDKRMGDLVQPSMGLTNSEWSAIRDDLRDSLLSAAARGVNLWVPEPHMMEHLGLIQGYDIHSPLVNWGATGFENVAGKVIDDAHLAVEQGGMTGTAYYSPTFQANYFRRIVATEPGLTDIPAYEMADRIYRYMPDRFNGYADVVAWDIVDKRGGLLIGDRVAMSMKDAANTAGGGVDFDPVGVIETISGGGRKSIVSARPEGIIGKVIAREQEYVYNSKGQLILNPYRNNATTIVAERGTVVRGTSIKGRIFMELMDSNISLSSYNVDRFPDMWLNVRNKNISSWSYDTRRYGPFSVGGTQVYIPITDSLPAISMNARGLKWLAKADTLPAGDVKVYVPSVESKLVTEDVKTTHDKSVTVNATPARSNLEVQEPVNPNRPDVLVRVPTVETELVANGIGKTIKVGVVDFDLVTNDVILAADMERIFVYIESSREFTLYLRED